ncbi:MAG: HD-GYP domain-containing protein [candidate division Zixibacteria bacterium]|nr:HD-GYP domain-containing protein [candidate division Zixibacteria bacterium]
METQANKKPKKNSPRENPKVIDRILNEMGKSLVNQLYATLKTAQIYERNNLVFVKQSEALISITYSILEREGEIHLRSKSGYLFLNRSRLIFNFEGYVSSRFIMDEFKHCQMEGIFIENGVTKREMDEFISQFVHLDKDKEDALETLDDKLNQLEVHHVRVERIRPDWVRPKTHQVAFSDMRKEAKHTFFKAISVAQEIMTSVKSGRAVNTVKAKRVIQSLVDQIIQDESSFLELTAIKNYDEYTFAHSVNVCVLAIAFGLKLGLDRKKLSELGFSALFHDIGKTKLPQELIQKPTEFDEEDWRQIKKHPVLGVKALFSRRELDEFSMRAAVVAFEHHLNLDLSGYPQVISTREVNLFTRIVSIVDAYDAMTSGRVYIKTPISPDEALRRMMLKRDVSFDPLLLKVFINIVGVYPIGSVVILNTGELAVVLGTNSNEINRPKVGIIADQKGKRKEIETVDLTEMDYKTNTYKRSILRTIDPRRYKIDVAKYVKI